MARVVALSLNSAHTFSKMNVSEIQLIEGMGVKGDAHMGKTVKHRSRVALDPSQPNLRQVHFLHSEVLKGLADRQFILKPGDIGENITTEGLYLLALPKGTQLFIGETILEVTGLRNPCMQLEAFQQGLLSAFLDKNQDGTLFRKAGIMAVVLKGGRIKINDTIELVLPPEPHERLERV